MNRTHSPERIVTLNSGRLMIVTDLHGDWQAYERCKERFLRGFAANDLDHIVFCGDLVHRESVPEEDASLRMLLDIRKWQSEGPGNVIYLMGNHELAQLYRIDLRKGDSHYTPRLAKAMGAKRAELLGYFSGLPFFVRTQAGLAIAHAGVGSSMLTPAGWQTLRHLDHDAEWHAVAARLSTDQRQQLREHINRVYPEGYARLNASSWNVQQPDDPFYDDIIIALSIQNDSLGHLLWNSFFTQNEREYGSEYKGMVNAFLNLLSSDFVEQRVLVTGHIGCQNGYTVVNEQQLRLASAAHALPRKTGKILLVDLDRPVTDANQLTADLQNLF